MTLVKCCVHTLIAAGRTKRHTARRAEPLRRPAPAAVNRSGGYFHLRLFPLYTIRPLPCVSLGPLRPQLCVSFHLLCVPLRPFCVSLRLLSCVSFRLLSCVSFRLSCVSFRLQLHPLRPLCVSLRFSLRPLCVSLRFSLRPLCVSLCLLSSHKFVHVVCHRRLLRLLPSRR